MPDGKRMRVIAGAYKGRRLGGLGDQSSELRPTSDRAREALFSILQRCPRGPFLDIFSGSGAVAIEALSRGYAPVWSIELDKKAIALIEENAKGTTLGIIKMDALKLEQDRFSGLSVIYADPPFEKSIEMWSRLAEKLGSFLAKGGVLAWECPKAAELPTTPGLRMACEKRYGASKLVFFEPQAI
jgi:16S rRNA (guanine966-N2)-methyltransferase